MSGLSQSLTDSKERFLPFFLLAAYFLGIYWRLHVVNGAFLLDDELHSLRIVLKGFRHVVTTFDQTGSGLALPLLQKILTDLFGFNHWSIRAPAYFAGIAALFFMYPVARRYVGNTAAAVATILLASNGFHIFYSHFARIYALVALGALLILASHWLVVHAERFKASGYFCMGLVTMLLPYAHITSLGFIVPVSLATFVVLLLTPKYRSRIWAFAMTQFLAAIGIILLHLPAWKSMLRFVREKTQSEYYGTFSILDVLTLMTGSRSGSWFVLIGIPLGAGWYLYRRKAQALPLVAAAIGPSIVLWLVSPYGDAYAYARYLFASLPALAILTAWLFLQFVRALFRNKMLISGVATGTSLIAALLIAYAGPTNQFRNENGPYTHVYASLYRLPAFDLAFPGTPSFYESLKNASSPVSIIEAPSLPNRAVYLYRNYYLQHRQNTIIALFPHTLERIPVGPYVSIHTDGRFDRHRADYLIVHKNLSKEIDRYWEFVYEEWTKNQNPRIAAFMERHRRFRTKYLGPIEPLLENLMNRFGKCIYEDSYIVVWKMPQSK